MGSNRPPSPAVESAVEAISKDEPQVLINQSTEDAGATITNGLHSSIRPQDIAVP
jgi:hypothetical protein